MKLKKLEIHQLNTKLTLYYSLVFFAILIMLMTLSYFYLQRSILKQVDETMTMQIELIKNSIETSTEASIKNFYRATAYSIIETIDTCYNKFQAGELSEDGAKQLAFNFISGKAIGPSGYAFVSDSEGILLFHPHSSIIGIDLKPYENTYIMLENDEIYFNYSWSNPGDKEPRNKSMYSIKYKKWNWIIGITGYQNELMSLITVKDFEDKILSIRFGDTGYPIVLDYTGTFLIHPQLKGENFSNRDDSMGDIIRKAITERNGISYYYWKNPDESNYRKKLTMYSDIQQLSMVVAATAYESEFLKPLNEMKRLFLISLVATLFIIYIFTRTISKRITKPIIELKNILRIASVGDLSVRAKVISSNEIDEIGEYFNDFITELEFNQKELKSQLDINTRMNSRLEGSLSELRNTQQLLIEEERFSSMGRLLARFSHHLNSPVGTAVTAGTFLIENLNKILTTRFENFENLDLLIDSSEVLKSSLTRITELMKSFKLLQISRDDIKYGVFNVLNLLSHHRDNSWLKQIPKGIDLEITCNKGISYKNSHELLIKVLDQLIQNSIDHSFKDSKSGIIRIEIDKLKSGILLNYVDSGKGIPQDAKDRIFEPFFNLENDFKSTGISLNVIYNIITVYMQGNIKYLGSENRGIHYEISLPNITEL